VETKERLVQAREGRISKKAATREKMARLQRLAQEAKAEKTQEALAAAAATLPPLRSDPGASATATAAAAAAAAEPSAAGQEAPQKGRSAYKIWAAMRTPQLRAERAALTAQYGTAKWLSATLSLGWPEMTEDDKLPFVLGAKEEREQQVREEEAYARSIGANVGVGLVEGRERRKRSSTTMLVGGQAVLKLNNYTLEDGEPALTDQYAAAPKKPAARKSAYTFFQTDPEIRARVQVSAGGAGRPLIGRPAPLLSSRRDSPY
jgi:hypothetical protein